MLQCDIVALAACDVQLSNIPWDVYTLRRCRRSRHCCCCCCVYTTACANRQDMLTISDIYKDDLPDDSIFVLEYPSSHKDNFGNPMFLVNSSRYLVSHDNWYKIIYSFTSDKGGGICFCPCSFVCLSVCLSVCLWVRLLKNACMDLDEMLRVDRCRDMDELINFWAPSGS